MTIRAPKTLNVTGGEGDSDAATTDAAEGEAATSAETGQTAE